MAELPDAVTLAHHRAEAVPALQRIVDSTQPEMVKQAAAKAIDAIRK